MRTLPGGSAFLQHGARRTPDGIRGGRVMAKALGVELMHELAGRVVVDRPESHDDAARARHSKGPLQSKHAFSVAKLSVAGVACRKYGPVHVTQVEGSNLLRSENGLRSAVIAAGEDQSRMEQWVAAAAALVQ